MEVQNINYSSQELKKDLRMLDLSIIKKQKQTEVDGKWIDASQYNEAYKGVRFKIARAGGTNKKYIRCHDALSRNLPRKDQQRQSNGLLSLEKSLEMNQRVFAQSIVLDWEGIGKNGKPVPCDEPHILELFSLDSDLFVWISEKAQDDNEFLSEELKTAGNA